MEARFGCAEQCFVENVVVSLRGERFELQRDVVAASSDQFSQSLEARRNRIALPSRDLSSVTADSRSELALRDAGTQPGVSDQVATSHGVSLAPSL